ncbi:SIR2 family NAD-dependent protein deacylase [Aquabacterium sp.]|uniref:SIR2 family NAD-dependent protein deacylase n=1 Tax=Aquabacterium sp. TaxID=1872578 RepID=UPI004037DB1D
MKLMPKRSTASTPALKFAAEVSQHPKLPMPTIYEDEVHITAIRAALSRGGAAVLVGAGFSRNAEGGKYVGTWADLAKALAAGMAPAGREISASVANATQLAEQYEQLFSRSHLEQVLKTVVPDERLSPGDLHHKLLSLPWSEVFTTNYDTLLERTAERLIDSSYFTVCCREDIPLSRVLGRRRIVKLHGSFSSQRPFILTEEDYRTYPQRFAPFVNLVRQALLENILCLVGFSGDDPNFLNWIGWVRDMLDRHALPIYLFVTEPPPRGQTLLLKARGVTPVVLPMGAGGEASDYTGRYSALLNAINPSADKGPNDWGKLSWPEEFMLYSDDAKKNYECYCRSLSIVLDHRKSYPGWLVAPYEVRRQFRGAFHHFGKWVHEPQVLKGLVDDEPSFALAAFDIYCWVQSVLLDELDDTVAVAAVNVLEATAELQISQFSEALLARLGILDCSSQSELSKCWTRVLLSTLAWARQTQHVAEFERVKLLAGQYRSNDPLVQDHVAYQSILHFLESGDRLSAQQALSRWSVRGSDVYMLVRWAALCAELGNVQTAITTCENALQSLRQQLRMSPDDHQLLSEESWASLIAMYLLKSREFSQSFGLTDGEDTSALPLLNADALDKRLDAVGRYSSKAELRRVLEQLRREAGVPYAQSFKHNQFESGAASNEIVFGVPGFVRSKVEAAATWFQLVEHVGLIPRMPGARFHDEDFLQAAWWCAYYFKQHDRALGILLRCAQESALKPRDETRPLHETGWLSPFQVALLSADRAAALAKQLATHVEAMLISASRQLGSDHDFDFSVKVLGRIILRVEDLDLIQRIARQLLGLHATSPLARQPEKWRPLSTVLACCMEALDQGRQLEVLLVAFKLPISPPDEPSGIYVEDWLPIEILGQHLEKARERPSNRIADWHEILSSLIETFQRSSDSQLLSRVWRRLFLAGDLGLLTAQQRRAIETKLWRSWRPGHSLPMIPQYHAHAVFKWAGSHLLAAQGEYKQQFLSQEFSPFSGDGYMGLHGAKSGRSWSLPFDRSQKTALQFLGTYEMSISLREYIAFIRKFESWLDRDGPALVADGAQSERLYSATRGVLVEVDLMLFRTFVRLDVNVHSADENLVLAMQALKGKAAAFGSHMVGLDILLAQLRRDSISGAAALGDLEMLLVAEDESRLRGAYFLASACLCSHDLLSTDAYQAIFDALVRITFCSLPVPMAWALDSLTRLPEEVWRQRLTDRNLYLLDSSLDQLFKRLAWDKNVDRNGILDDSVPVLRTKCTGLAYVMRERAAYLSPAAEKWLSAAPSDPLPELRLGRFKH